MTNESEIRKGYQGMSKDSKGGNGASGGLTRTNAGSVDKGSVTPLSTGKGGSAPVKGGKK